MHCFRFRLTSRRWYCNSNLYLALREISMSCWFHFNLQESRQESHTDSSSGLTSVYHYRLMRYRYMTTNMTIWHKWDHLIGWLQTQPCNLWYGGTEGSISDSQLQYRGLVVQRGTKGPFSLLYIKGLCPYKRWKMSTCQVISLQLI